jgi:hypothetical protein
MPKERYIRYFKVTLDEDPRPKGGKLKLNYVAPFWKENQ